MHGNTTVENTKNNASKCLSAFAAPETVKVYRGAARPLLRPARHDSQIHGPDGLGGVEGLPSAESTSVRERIESSPAIEAIASAIRQTWDNGAGSKVTLVASGPLTNIALFVSVYTDLFEAIDQIVFMGGGIGVGNRSAVAGSSTRSAFAHLIYITDVRSEFNILCDRRFQFPFAPPSSCLIFALARYSRSRSDCYRCTDTESDDTPERHSQGHRNQVSP